MSEKDNKNNSLFVYILVLIIYVLSIIGILDILNQLIYPNSNVILIPIICGFSLWILLEIRKNLNYKPPKKPRKMYYRNKQKKFDRKRAWEYHNKADIIFQHRISFFSAHFCTNEKQLGNHS